MLKHVFSGVFLLNFALVLAKEAELPLCPTNVLYFPQNLPMHCRMPTNADLPGITVPQLYQNPPSDKRPPLPVPISNPPGVPGPMPIPGLMPMPGVMPIPGQMAMPGPMPISGPMAIPGPLPVSGPSGPIPFSGPMPLSPGPSNKLPVIVMPFYSPDTSFKKIGKSNYPQHSLRPKRWKIRHRRKRPLAYSSPDTSSSTDTETSSETSSSASSEYQGWWKGRRNHRRFNGLTGNKRRKYYQRRQLLTPVLQYVTKDGYVIFEKRISKNEAKDWLSVKKDQKLEFNTQVSPEARDMESNEPNDSHTGEKQVMSDDNVEVMTKRNTLRLNRIKTHREKAGRKNRPFEKPH